MMHHLDSMPSSFVALIHLRSLGLLQGQMCQDVCREGGAQPLPRRRATDALEVDTCSVEDELMLNEPKVRVGCVLPLGPLLVGG